MSRQLRMLDDGSRLVELTTRTQHGRFLLLASDKANDIILGVLGRAQAKYDVSLHAYNFQRLQRGPRRLTARLARCFERYLCFDERRPLSEDGDRVPFLLQDVAIRIPGHRDRLLGVVEKVHVS